MTNQNATPNKPDSTDSSTATMLFAAISSVLVVIVMGIFIVILVIRSSSDTGINSPNGPYNVGARLLPKTSNPGVVLPATLGDFQRQNVSGTISDFTALYTRGTEKITISGGQMVNFPAAQQIIISLRDKYGPPNKINRISTGQPRLSIYLDVRDAAIRLAYNHDQWYFDLQTDSQHTLDDFMQVFPF